MVDDFDAELEEAEKQARGAPESAKPSPTAPSPAAPEPAAQRPRPQTPAVPEPRAQSSAAAVQPQTPAKPEAEKRQPARAMSARRPGPVAKVRETLAGSLGGVKSLRFSLNTLAWILLGLIVFALLAENWSPVRVNLFGIYVDIPKSMAFLVNLGLGALALWLVQRSISGRLARQKGDEDQ